MDCKEFENELPDLMLSASATPSPNAAAHLEGCANCTAELRSLRETFALLDQWTVPEPSAYFDQKLAVRMREEQAAPPMNWLERMQTRLLLNTGRGFQPALAGALALALLVGGGSYAGLHTHATETPVASASAAVNDLQIMDRNEQALQQMDELQGDGSDASTPAQDGSPDGGPAPIS